jgi:hypothetical protein
LATIEIPNLSWLLNDPIQHNPGWLVVPVNILSYIAKFVGKSREDLTNHITTYHP